MHRNKCRQALRYGRCRHTRSQHTGGGGQGVFDVVAPGNLQLELQALDLPAEPGLRLHPPVAALPLRIQQAHVVVGFSNCGRRIAEGDAAPCTGEAAPQGGIDIVCGKNGHAMGGQGADHSPVFGGDRVHRVHEFQMLALRVVHQRHGGLYHRAETGDFAGVVHAEFDHADAVFAAQAQHGQRHANVVVQVALGGQRRAVRRMQMQDGSNHLRDRGFAVAAGHTNQGQVPLRAPVGAQRSQSVLRIGYFDPRQGCGIGCPGLGMAEDRDRTLRQGLGQKLVGVKGVAAQGHK